MSWNLRRLTDISAAHSVIADLTPEVVLLQEAGSPSDTRDLARSLGMEAIIAPRPIMRRPIANAILVRPSIDVREARLERFPGTGVREPRGALIVDAVRQGQRIRPISAHLGLDARERVRHARLLASSTGARSVLGVDLNALPDSVAAGAIADAGTDALAAMGRGDDPSFPAAAAESPIDRIVVGRAWEVTRAWVVGDDRADLLSAIVRASDHRPVVADLLLHSDA